MRLWCIMFGHGFDPPVLNARGAHSHMACRRCGLFLVPDYYDGWQRATKLERSARLRAMRSNPPI